jgi:molecular chaperone DnaJ
VASRTHYDVLGIDADAPLAAIRDAYRELARVHHPDRHGSAAGGAVADDMAAINEAYRVLSDPARRAVYDAGLRGNGSAVPPSTARTTTEDDDLVWSGVRPGAIHPSQLGPARVPWRMMLLLTVLGVVGVLVLAQFTKPGQPPGPDGILRPGNCVALEANGDAREVSCSKESANLVLVALVPFDATCPNGTEPHRDRQGMGVACITRTTPP